MKKVKIDRVVRKHYATVDNKEVELVKTTNIEHYGKDVVIYVNTLAKGKNAGKEEYFVQPKDYKATRKQADKTTAKELLAQGLSAEEIVARLTQ